ncbi:hypothetical protein BH721_05915 [Clostridium baratii]|uniref:FUSC family protein n=1 Tax=Clostridium baratii TaxID=1561 RepID=UPI0009A2DB41|nr:FUSC family protein [Clostridium baratii]OPF52794.1 hypothetical protein A1M12_12125 [Clostridium baratii]OPF56243.1 hypothetical protein BH721_05915 [Clostridium baratii]OPF58162.1 hypothetical protein BH724_04660 [Clostridium baratii]OPF59375.1 hypothetical protein BH725_02005 [Clostridium baratii]
MDKKLILVSLSKAIFTVCMIVLYKVLFGPENISVGLMVAFSVIAFLKLDFSLYPLYRGTVFAALSFFLLIMSFLAGLNPFLGLIINLFTIFTVSYLYMKESKNMVSYLFLFIYIYMVSINVPVELLPKRFLSLMFGVLIIVVSQLLFNKNKFNKKSSTLLLNGLSNIKDGITNLLDNKEYDSSILNNKMRELLNLIDEQNSNAFFSTILLKHYFNIAISLERLAININKVKLISDLNIKNSFLNDLNLEISNLINVLSKDKLNSIDFSLKYKDNFKQYPILKECSDLLGILNSNFLSLNNYKHKIKIKLKDIKLKKKNLNINSLDCNFSVKVALAVSIPLFFIELFNIPNGKWIIITIYVLLQPLSDDTIIKTKKRIKGTIIAVSVFILIFRILNINIPESLFLFVLMFFYFYAKDYYIKVIFTSLLALSVNLSNYSLEILSTTRFTFIIVGSIIALLVNKYLLPYTKLHHKNSLKDKYLILSNSLTNELCNLVDGNINEDRLIKLALHSNLIESKLLLLANNLNDSSLKNIITSENKIIKSIRFSILNIYSSKIKRSLS